MAGCGKFADGTSVWAAGLWVLPCITALATLFFANKVYVSWREGGKKGYFTDAKGKVSWTEDNERFPIYEASYFYFTVFCFLSTIAIIVWVNFEK